MSGETLTCVSCNATFNDPELQRNHFKSDWHRYNLKRKVADLPVVSFDVFRERAQMQQKLEDNAQHSKQEELFCKLCSKHFTTPNSFTNHKQSKKHQELEQFVLSQKSSALQTQNDTNKLADDDVVIKSTKKAAAPLTNETTPTTATSVAEADDEESWEDIDEDELDDSMFDESKAIPLNTCLFCEHVSNSPLGKLEHMGKEHSFFIPDVDHVSDMEGLLKFLGLKVGAYHVCLWCSSKCYKDVQSAQKHMQDKGHSKMRFEGETLYEYADFYSYDDDDENNEGDMSTSFEMVDVNSASPAKYDNNENSEMFELVLPSGNRIGHRSLFRYYKQSFGHRSMELKLHKNTTLRDKYKAIASGSSGAYSQTEVNKQRKDIAYLQRWKARMQVKMGWESNKLQKHFRRQDITF